MYKDFSKYEEELLNTLQKAVKIRSINPPGNEFEMCNFVYDFMANLGIETHKVNVSKNRYNVISVIKGKSSENGIIFTGHMDVVPVSDDELKRWSVDPFSGIVKNSFLYGRGSADMKSGLCSAMLAMKYIKENNIVPNKDIALVATIDEEDGMKGSKALSGNKILENFTNVVVCEPTNLELCTIGRGRTYGIIDIKGKTGHGSQISLESNAILIANRIIDKMMSIDLSNKASEEFGCSFWQPMSIHASVDPWVVPDDCRLGIDARLVPNHYCSDIWDRIDNIVKEIKEELPKVKIDINILDKREPWITNSSTPLVVNLNKIYEDLNYPLTITEFKGTTDGTVLKREGREVVIVGPGLLADVHKENEKVSIEDLNKAFRLYLELMKI